MNTNKIQQHAVSVANYDNAHDQSAGIQASELMLAMIDAGAQETPNGNYKFATYGEYKTARGAWVSAYGNKRGWTKDSGKRNPGDNRFSDLGGSSFDPRTEDISPEDLARAAEAEAEAKPVDEIKTRRAELMKAYNKAIMAKDSQKAHDITNELLAL